VLGEEAPVIQSPSNQQDAGLSVALEVSNPSQSSSTSIQMEIDSTPPASITVDVGVALLHSLYARFKASTFRFDFSDEVNMATLAAIPLVQAHMQTRSTFSEHELFSLIFRYNRPYPTGAEEESSVISRRFVGPELLDIATGLVLRCVRMRFRDARAMMGHLGGAHNAPDLRFFLTHGEVFMVVPRHHLDSLPHPPADTGEEEEEEHESEEENDGGDGEEGDDGANPWLFLRANVKHAITDKASVVAALRCVLTEARDHRLTLLVLRQRFERDCGVPFGSVGCGSLTSFLKKQRSTFHVAESHKKKNIKSTVTLVSSSSSAASRSQRAPRGNGAQPPLGTGGPRGRGANPDRSEASTTRERAWAWRWRAGSRPTRRRTVVVEGRTVQG
jgi:hypothetical protein